MNSEPQMDTDLFRVLIMEDEVPLRKSLAAILRSGLPGIEILQAGTIHEGLEQIEQNPKLTLGILDIRVPKDVFFNEEANPEVADRLRELNVPCIFMTGYKESDDVTSYLQQRSIADPNVVVIEKLIKAGHLSSEIIRHARPLFEKIACERVNKVIEEVFSNGVQGNRSTTAGWINAQKCIAAYWAYLNDATKENVRKWVNLKETENGEIQISLFEAGDL